MRRRNCRTAALLVAEKAPNANASAVSVRPRGSYRKNAPRAQMRGVCIIEASAWKRPSATNTTASTASDNGAAVQPSVSAADSGRAWGTVIGFVK